jgi:mono/diheme cytochrome c family protein
VAWPLLRSHLNLEETTKIFLTLGFVLVLVTAADAAEEASSNRQIARGKYIVEQVAMCVQCHTPRNANGQLLVTRYLQGAPVPVTAPAYFQIEWAYKAPAIAGLPGYTKQEGVRLLTEGITRDQRSPKAPMPKFRLTRADAEAVVDYLKSLR